MNARKAVLARDTASLLFLLDPGSSVLGILAVEGGLGDDEGVASVW